jgi:putative ABC transport system ATP-binding protein
MLELVGLSQRRTHLPDMLSGGEQQRVAIARSLVMDPAFLLADEPTGNLDSANGRQVTSLLRDLVDLRRQTVVIVTHDPGVAAAADRIVRLRDGVVESDGGKLGRRQARDSLHPERNLP